MTGVSRTCSFAVVSTTLPSNAYGAATFHFDTRDPFAVTLDFSPGSDGSKQTWRISRDLLADGLTRLAGVGDVACWTVGPWYHLALSSSDGQVVLAFIAETVRVFLVDAEDLVPYGAEDGAHDAEFDADLLLLTGEQQ